jgi:hypothetical protein
MATEWGPRAQPAPHWAQYADATTVHALTAGAPWTFSMPVLAQEVHNPDAASTDWWDQAANKVRIPNNGEVYLLVVGIDFSAGGINQEIVGEVKVVAAVVFSFRWQLDLFGAGRYSTVIPIASTAAISASGLQIVLTPSRNGNVTTAGMAIYKAR